MKNKNITRDQVREWFEGGLKAYLLKEGDVLDFKPKKGISAKLPTHDDIAQFHQAVDSGYAAIAELAQISDLSREDPSYIVDFDVESMRLITHLLLELSEIMSTTDLNSDI